MSEIPFPSLESGFGQHSVETTFYRGLVPKVIKLASEEQLTEKMLNNIIQKLRKGGIEVTHVRSRPETGLDSDGVYRLNLPFRTKSWGKLHEVIHVEQDLRAILDGIEATILQNVPSFNRAMAEIQAISIEQKHIKKMGGTRRRRIYCTETS